MTDDELQARFIDEFTALCRDRQIISVEMTPLQCWVIASQLQLAFRHPENTGPARDLAEKVVLELFKRVATTPALAEMARRGGGPAYDVKIEEDHNG